VIDFLSQLAAGAIEFFKVGAECPPVALAIFGYALLKFHEKTGKWYDQSIDFYVYFVAAAVVSAAAAWSVARMISAIGVPVGVGSGIISSFRADPIAFILFLIFSFFLIFLYFLHRYAKSSYSPGFFQKYREASIQLKSLTLVFFFTAFLPAYVFNTVWLAVKPSPAALEDEIK
jgi:hypothetical protein